MSFVLIALAAVCVFGAAAAGGRLLARHYNDALEVAGVLLVAASVLAPAALIYFGGLTLDAPSIAVFFVAFAVGLFTGYSRPDTPAPRT